MNDIKYFLIILFAAVLFIAGLLWLTYKPTASVVNSTSYYVMPEELKDYQVYVLVGKGHCQNLYVICKNKKPVGISWEERSGKTSTKFDVLTPELND
jgi:hypothetical protein